MLSARTSLWSAVALPPLGARRLASVQWVAHAVLRPRAVRVRVSGEHHDVTRRACSLCRGQDRLHSRSLACRLTVTGEERVAGRHVQHQEHRPRVAARQLLLEPRVLAGVECERACRYIDDQDVGRPEIGRGDGRPECAPEARARQRPADLVIARRDERRHPHAAEGRNRAVVVDLLIVLDEVAAEDHERRLVGFFPRQVLVKNRRG